MRELTREELADATEFLAKNPKGELVIEDGVSVGYPWSPATTFDPPIRVRLDDNGAMRVTESQP